MLSTIYSKEETDEPQSQPKLVQNMSSPPDRPMPKWFQDIAQSQISSEMSLLYGFTQGKIITITYAKFGENMKLETVHGEGIWDLNSKEIPPYAGPLYRPPPYTLF